MPASSLLAASEQKGSYCGISTDTFSALLSSFFHPSNPFQRQNIIVRRTLLRGGCQPAPEDIAEAKRRPAPLRVDASLGPDQPQGRARHLCAAPQLSLPLRIPQERPQRSCAPTYCSHGGSGASNYGDGCWSHPFRHCRCTCLRRCHCRPRVAATAFERGANVRPLTFALRSSVCCLLLCRGTYGVPAAHHATVQALPCCCSDAECRDQPSHLFPDV